MLQLMMLLAIWKYSFHFFEIHRDTEFESDKITVEYITVQIEVEHMFKENHIIYRKRYFYEIINYDIIHLAYTNFLKLIIS